MSQHHQASPTTIPSTGGKLIRWADYYDPLVSLFTLARRSKLRQATVDLARLQPGASVLEVGCGTGDVALLASDQVGASGSVVGIDPSPEMIAVARRKAEKTGRTVDFQSGVIEALAFADHTFDVVFSSLMMHHLPAEIKQRGLAEIARVLKPGGVLVIIDMKQARTHRERLVKTLMLHGAMGNGVQHLPPLLQAAGFTQVETGDTNLRMVGYVRAHTPA